MNRSRTSIKIMLYVISVLKFFKCGHGEIPNSCSNSPENDRADMSGSYSALNKKIKIYVGGFWAGSIVIKY